MLHLISPEKNTAERYYNQAINYYKNGLADSAYVYLNKSIDEKHIESYLPKDIYYICKNNMKMLIYISICIF
jgi:hypothetical protein